MKLAILGVWLRRACVFALMLTSGFVGAGACKYALAGTRLLLSGRVNNRVETAPEILRPFSVIQDSGRQSIIDLRQRTALVMLYNPTCRACELNMSRWLELLAAERRPDIEFLAIGRPGAREAQYWEHLRGKVHLVTAVRDSEVTHQFHAPGSPTTVLVREGRVVAAFWGVLNRWQMDYLLRAIQPGGNHA